MIISGNRINKQAAVLYELYVRLGWLEDKYGVIDDRTDNNQK